GARLHAAVELRQRDHRALEFLGQRLQAARDLADHGGAVLLAAAAAAAHELQVVDDDQPELPALPRLPPRTGAHLAGRQPRALVDEHGDRAELLDRLGQATPFVILQRTGAQALL